MYFPLYLLFIFFVIVSYYYSTSNGKLFLLILIIYTISAACSILYVYSDFFSNSNKYNTNLNYLPFVFWIISFFLISRPIIYYDRKKTNGLLVNVRLFEYASLIGLIMGIPPLIDMVPQITKVFYASNLTSTISELHDDETVSINFSALGLICFRIINSIYQFFLFCAIPILMTPNRKRIYIIGLLIVVIDVNLASLLTGSRSVMINTIIDFALLYLLFCPFFDKKISHAINTYLLLMTGASVILFLIITIFRGLGYQENDSKDLLTFLIQYVGEGFVNFHLYIDNIREYNHGNQCFWVFKNIMGLDVPNIKGEAGLRYLYQLHIGIPAMVFYTFIGFFVIDIGPLGTLIFFFLLSQIVQNITKNSIGSKKIVPTHTLFLLYIYASIIANGTCLYKYSWKESIHIIYYVFIYFILKYNNFNLIFFKSSNNKNQNEYSINNTNKEFNY